MIHYKTNFLHPIFIRRFIEKQYLKLDNIKTATWNVDRQHIDIWTESRFRSRSWKSHGESCIRCTSAVNKSRTAKSDVDNIRYSHSRANFTSGVGMCNSLCVCRTAIYYSNSIIEKAYELLHLQRWSFLLLIEKKIIRYSIESLYGFRFTFPAEKYRRFHYEVFSFFRHRQRNKSFYFFPFADDSLYTCTYSIKLIARFQLKPTPKMGFALPIRSSDGTECNAGFYAWWKVRFYCFIFVFVIFCRFITSVQFFTSPVPLFGILGLYFFMRGILSKLANTWDITQSSTFIENTYIIFINKYWIISQIYFEILKNFNWSIL